MSTETPQPSRQLILTRSAYLDALEALLPMARSTIRIFDTDLAGLGFERLDRIERLRTFLSADRNNAIQIVVHDTSHILRNGARLIDLQQGFSAKLAIYQSEGEACRAQDCFVLVDARHFVRRPVAGQTRGVFALHEAREGRLLAERFAEIAACSQPANLGTATGL
jgi:hypothetical protein